MVCHFLSMSAHSQPKGRRWSAFACKMGPGSLPKHRHFLGCSAWKSRCHQRYDIFQRSVGGSAVRFVAVNESVCCLFPDVEQSIIVTETPSVSRSLPRYEFSKVFHPVIGWRIARCPLFVATANFSALDAFPCPKATADGVYRLTEVFHQ